MKSRDRKRLQQFRQNLKRLRTERNLSQRGLSYLCDVDYSKIGKLESNENTNLTLTTLFELAKGLGVHPKELIDYEFEFLKK
ncbi:MAG TPA: helix-turn-helix transcriptional regulator [Cyclobacteriaceae bacterium]|nr:helix-turn-helix transcriptional regulator [Cytophagales bacterium]HRE65802.1 helix-turn-helix transcriptional regulator [Cyclobacteriaceae bacterium]